jgi:hypothetical protein
MRTSVFASLMFAAACSRSAPQAHPDIPGSQTSTQAVVETPAAPASPREQGGQGAHGAQAAQAAQRGPILQAAVGQAAPDFTLPDLDGAKIHLALFRGKTVVLEWYNPGCPFVRASHTKGSLKDAQKRRGAIDNSPDGEGESPTDGKLLNYVDAALADLAAGRPVAVAETKAYGCSVKYASK